MVVVGCKILHFINNEDQEALSYKTQQHTNVVASYREIKHLVTISVYERSKVVWKETLHMHISLGQISDLEILKL